MLGQSSLGTSSIGSSLSTIAIFVSNLWYQKTADNIVDFGNEVHGNSNIDERGICYKISGGDMPNISDSKVSETGDFAPDDYEMTVRSLSTNTTYMFRAYIISNGIVKYSEPLEVLTDAIHKRISILLTR